jgi:hypothetical protein
MPNNRYPTNGMNRRELDAIIIELGGTIEYPRRTGDALYRHPAVAHPVRVNSRRKDSTRALVALARAAYDAAHHDDHREAVGGGELDYVVAFGEEGLP